MRASQTHESADGSGVLIGVASAAGKRPQRAALRP